SFLLFSCLSSLLVLHSFPTRRSSDLIASVIGIPIGTVISTTFSWHDSFWMISGLTIFVFVSLIWLVPEDTPQCKSTLRRQCTLLKETRVLLGVVFIVTVCAADSTIYTYIRPLIT